VEHSERTRVLRNWRDERDSAALYAALAAAERNAHLSRVFAKLAAEEREHSEFWEERLRDAGETLPPYQVSPRTRLVAALARRFGVAFVIPSITARELADRDRYSSQEDAIAAGLSSAEHDHAAIMRAVSTYAHVPDVAKGTDRRPGPRAFANNLRAAILGANDGLASNFCLIMGVAGGGAQSTTVLLTGVAGLVAGACSMALGEWLSVTNVREMAKSQIDHELADSRATPPRDHARLALYYQAKGMTEDEARCMADRILAGEPDAIDRHAREELGLDASMMGNDPTSAAAHSFVLFAIGALVPVLPFFVVSASRGIIATIVLSLLALFAIGLMTSFFSGRPLLFSGFRQVGIGAAAAAVTYTAGRIFGAVAG
jgi:VIT1/CCC1 family predicted Fe2+/Mn2+ transporter